MNEIEAPFVGTGKEFKEEFEELANKYGIPRYFLVFSEDYDERTYEYHFFNSELPEEFLEYVEEKIEDMRDSIHE